MVETTRQDRHRPWYVLHLRQRQPSFADPPGLKRITLKVRVNNPQATWRPSPNSAISPASGPSLEPVIGEDGLPTTPIMLHLLDVFTKHFGCQFPFVNPKELSAQIAERTGSVFLFHSIAAIAARSVPLR